MKSRVEIYKTNFFINEEKKVVTCVTTADLNIVKLNFPHIILSTNKVFTKLGIDNTTEVVEVGIAKCNPMDVFNIEKGKKIAESRAKQQLFKKVSKLYEFINDEILNISSYYDELSETCLNIAQNESDYLENKLIED